jgi:hypothetical protein
MGLTTSSLPSRAGPPLSVASAAVFAAFDDTSVVLERGENTTRVPVAIWYPTEQSNATETERVTESSSLFYPHAISISKIARVLLRLEMKLPTLFDRKIELVPAKGVTRSDKNSPPQTSFSKACILCHGYLGSRFDLVDFAERLAAEGYVVLAPEFSDSLANANTMPNNTRGEILQKCVGLLESRFGIRSKKQVAIVGHSAGSGTVMQAEGNYLGRVCIAGFRPVLGADRSDALSDPLLVIASEGDNVISLFPSDGRFGKSDGIVSAVGGLGKPVLDVQGTSAGLRDFTLSLEEKKKKEEASSEKVSFVQYRGPGSPCHISFLSSRTNDAMVEALSALLPAAKFLNIPLLDFDVYEQTRDSDQVAKDLVPAVATFLDSCL